MQRILRCHLKKLKTLLVLFVYCAAVSAEENLRVVMHTTMGKIELELFRKKAPTSVKNFLSYAEKDYYNGTIVHRVIENFMIQGGGFTRDMTQKKTAPPITNEASNGLSNERGTIAMARTNDPDSATSQFFIKSGRQPRSGCPTWQAGLCCLRSRRQRHRNSRQNRQGQDHHARATPERSRKTRNYRADNRCGNPRARSGPHKMRRPKRPRKVATPEATAQNAPPEATAQSATPEATAQNAPPEATAQSATPEATAQSAPPEATAQSATPSETAEKSGLRERIKSRLQKFFREVYDKFF